MRNIATARRSASTPQPQATPSYRESVGEDSSNPRTLLADINDFAVESRVSPKTIRRMLAAGKLPAPIKFGKRLRWRRADIEAWFAKGAQTPRLSPSSHVHK